MIMIQPPQSLRPLLHPRCLDSGATPPVLLALSSGWVRWLASERQRQRLAVAGLAVAAVHLQ